MWDFKPQDLQYCCFSKLKSLLTFSTVFLCQTLYVFQLVMDGLGGQASFTSITEYLLTQPVLSFVIAGHAPCPSTNEVTGGGESGEEGEGERAELSERANRDSRLVAVHIKLFCIHTRYIYLM